MNDTTIALPQDGGTDSLATKNVWKRVIIWYPRIALCDTPMGVRRRLVLPGIRRMRLSRSYKRYVYRR